MVTICTASLTFNNSTFYPRSVFMCFVWIWERTAIISLYNINWLILVAFEKCRKATVSFFIPLRPSIRMKQIDPTGRIFMKFDIWQFKKKLFKFHYNLTKKRIIFFMKIYCNLWYLAEFFLRWEMFHTKLLEKIKTHILCFWLKSSRCVKGANINR